MKTYILTVEESYGEYVYAVFAESFRDAYEKIKNDDGEFDLKVNDDFVYREPNHCRFTCNKYRMKCVCRLIELKESNHVVELGGYAE
jgi:hypothetical protein